MSELPEDFGEDLHELVQHMTGAIRWISGTIHGMGVLEANAVKLAEDLDQVATYTGGGLQEVATALREGLHEIAQAIASSSGGR